MNEMLFEKYATSNSDFFAWNTDADGRRSTIVGCIQLVGGAWYANTDHALCEPFSDPEAAARHDSILQQKAPRDSL